MQIYSDKKCVNFFVVEEIPLIFFNIVKEIYANISVFALSFDIEHSYHVVY